MTSTDKIFHIPNRLALISGILDSKSLLTDADESDDYYTNYKDPLEIFVPVSYQGVQNVNQKSISLSSKSKVTEYKTFQIDKYPSASIGPYKLGESVVLRCISKGGHPLPNVTWWKDNSVLGIYENAKDYI